ncbi:Pycsar system effector family protein [Sanyastnella coralliicola]|uniref:Pycsar system effector family protein n=1 Tax=Sanyastnella coralliicola TaxID=3069118 RepID=UPI0027BA476F|nr:Pycsar system effector family protein [Longitalea sp. SCSIO 12813]
MEEQYWNILSKTTDWIKFSDTKAVVVLTVYGILITVVYSNSLAVYEFISESWFFILLTVPAVLLSVLSIVYCFKAINPRLKNDNPNSLIYFGHIQEKFSNSKDYHEELSKALNATNKFEQHLSEQIHTNSKIAWSKFKNISIAIRLFVATLGVLILELITYFLTR